MERLKIVAWVIVGGERVRYSIPCPSGRNVKWLACVCSQRYADDTALQLRPWDARLRGNLLDPEALLDSILTQGDEVEVTLQGTVNLDPYGNPITSKWAEAAFQSRAVDFDRENSREVPPEVESDEAIKSKVDFIRTTMTQQMLDWKKIAHIVNTFWHEVADVFPRLRSEEERLVRELCVSNVLVIEDMYRAYVSSEAMQLSEFQQLLSDVNVFPKKDSHALASRAFQFVQKAAEGQERGLGLGGFVAALLLVSQIRHNDTFESQHALLRPAEGFARLLSTNIRPLAELQEYECLVREVFASDAFLYKLFFLRKELFTVFEKAERTDYSSLPLALMLQLLADSKLGVDHEAKLSKLLKKVQSGYIHGRSTHAAAMIRRVENLNGGAPSSTVEEVFLFPEFIECICRAAYLHDPGPLSESRLTATFVSGLEKVVLTMKAPTPSEVKNATKRR